jgi:DmsE family decaheme c-type cytochrome
MAPHPDRRRRGWTRALAALAGLVVALPLLGLGGPAAAASPPAVPGATYVGSDICKGCHEDQFKTLTPTIHSRVLGPNGRTELQGHVCEACHGPGSKHVENQADPATIVRFGPKSAQPEKARDAVCLQCHQRGKRMFWQGSQHDAVNTCTTCHSVHTPQSASGQLKTKDQLSLCRQCHAVSVAQQWNWSHMPVREGKLQCNSCHNVHGTTTEKLIIDNSVNENCYRCHLDKRGPFLWEHAPVRESCLNCHKPHGSNNIRLLRVREPRLCQQCHNEAQHPSTAFGRTATSTGILDRRVLGRSCALCHSNIHGSNHPSGFAFTR